MSICQPWFRLTASKCLATSTCISKSSDQLKRMVARHFRPQNHGGAGLSHRSVLQLKVCKTYAIIIRQTKVDDAIYAQIRGTNTGRPDVQGVGDEGYWV